MFKKIFLKTEVARCDLVGNEFYILIACQRYDPGIFLWTVAEAAFQWEIIAGRFEIIAGYDGKSDIRHVDIHGSVLHDPRKKRV